MFQNDIYRTRSPRTGRKHPSAPESLPEFPRRVSKYSLASRCGVDRQPLGRPPLSPPKGSGKLAGAYCGPICRARRKVLARQPEREPSFPATRLAASLCPSGGRDERGGQAVEGRILSCKIRISPEARPAFKLKESGSQSSNSEGSQRASRSDQRNHQPWRTTSPRALNHEGFAHHALPRTATNSFSVTSAAAAQARHGLSFIIVRYYNEGGREKVTPIPAAPRRARGTSPRPPQLGVVMTRICAHHQVHATHQRRCLRVCRNGR